MSQGQGLSSLIPNKKNNQNNQNSDFVNNQDFDNTQFQNNQNQQSGDNTQQNNLQNKALIFGDNNQQGYQDTPIYYPSQKNQHNNYRNHSNIQKTQKREINQSQFNSPQQIQSEPAPFKINLDKNKETQEVIKKEEFNNQILPQQRKQSASEPKKDNIEYKEQAIFQIEVGKIKPNPFQPRKEYDFKKLEGLVQSIREVGIIQPLVVSKIEEEVENGTKIYYQLISGERRLKASKLIGLKTVPVIVHKEEVEQNKLSMALIENIQRSDLNSIETARAYSRLQDDFNLTQREIATKVGKSRESISNTLRLLNLPTDIQNAVSQNKLNESHARILLSVKSPSLRDELFQKLLKKNITTRKLISLAKGGKKKKIKFKNNYSAFSQEENFWAKQIEDHLGIPVLINSKGNEKQLIFKLHTQEEWDSLMKHLIEED